MPRLIPCLAVWLAMIAISQASVINVPSNQPTIQAGIDAALPGDTVLVADGTYTGAGNRDILIAKAIVLMSEHGPDATVIDCQASIPDPHFGFEIKDCRAAGVVIKGFTITGGYASGGSALRANSATLSVDSCFIRNNGGDDACFGTSSSLSFRACRIEQNTGYGMRTGNFGDTYLERCVVAGNEVGMRLSFEARTRITACSFTSNHSSGLVLNIVMDAVIAGSEFSDNGQGLQAMLDMGEPMFAVTRCEFLRNGPASEGGGLQLYFEPFGGLVSIDSCRFVGNSADYGGGAHVYLTDQPLAWELFRGCVFEDNSAAQGGGLFLKVLTGQSIENCVFIKNSAEQGGGVFEYDSQNAVIQGCTFYANQASSGCQLYFGSDSRRDNSLSVDRCIMTDSRSGGAVDVSDGGIVPIFDCSDLWANEGGDWVGGIADQYDLRGNGSFDPLYCNPVGGIYTLFDFSPCTPANNSCGQLIGAYDVGCTVVTALSMQDESSMTNVVRHTPVLAWTSTPTPGLVQTACEIEVGTDRDWSQAEMWNTGIVESSDNHIIYAGVPLDDGATYFIRLRLRLNGSWTPWYETMFRMNSHPSIPDMAFPENGTVIDGRPTLIVRNATDPENDPLFYQYEIAADSASEVPIAVSDLISQGADSTCWTHGDTVADNNIYIWRCRVWDGYEYSDWSPYWHFVLDTAPDPPEIPETVPPQGTGTVLYDMLPTFTWTEVTDPDPLDAVTYHLELSTDSGFNPVVSIDALAEPAGRFADSLLFQTHYWWRVKVADRSGLISTSPPADFWTWTLGDLNQSHECSISDVSLLIDHVLISRAPIEPAKIGDVNGSCNISIGDVMLLIEHLFISGAELQVGCQ